MQVKNSLVLLTALTAGSAVARLHGHERRHQHHERGVGTWVTAVIDGQTVSWQNTYAGPTEAAAVAASSATEAAAAAATTEATVANVKNVDDVKVSSSATATTTSTASSTASGFGGVTSPSGTGVTYCGNVGIPYGSNIIEISKDELDSYNYTITLDGSNLSEDYKAYFWNSCTESGSLAGFFDTVFPLTVTISAGSSAYVALDVDTQGAFVTAPSSSDVPRNSASGIILGFWGEFGFGTTINDGWSGFDVSAIEAQIAGITDYPGLKITGDGQTSSITTGLGTVSNAYTQDLTDVGGIGGNVSPGSIALTATLNYSG
ncbi:hypothetical protein UA08_00095 [Talaromyces atroroseus]|uniref:Allergen Asp f 4 n=1 Tax=Talaromyces atroroseus TaxID=1441469 RepID=A0A225BF29_TALAT|nr:hypothetical protein UA08_00095 [Talaromyces atroroseus]OKL64657.1 hypothetical protein UA08_00095 [Talaromyces atroroseus]